MSCYQIYYKDGHKYARPVASREEYLKLRNSQVQLENLKKAREGDEEAKRKLEQMLYGCLPNEDGTLKESLNMAMSVPMDVDHIKEEDMAKVAENILAKKDELGLLMLEKSARGAGYHIVFKRKFVDGVVKIKESETENQVKNLRWASDLLGVEFDPGAKDITRVFFTTSAEKEDLLYLDDELFDNEEVSPSQPFPKGKGLQTCSNKDNKQEASQAASPLLGRGKGEAFDTFFNGIPYTLILSELENQLGGAPAHGNRNQFIFNMACQLRHICNDDPNWIAEILPTYGEERAKWWNTIQSACKRSQSKTMPDTLVRAIALAKKAYGSEEEDELPPAMPKRLPKMCKAYGSKTPLFLLPTVLQSMFPPAAAHCYDLRFPYVDNVPHEPTMMDVLMAPTGAGKSCINEPIRHMMMDIEAADKVNLDRLKEYNKECNRRGDSKDKEDRPEGLITQILDVNITQAAFMQQMAEAEEHPLYLQVNEIDMMDALAQGGPKGSQYKIMELSFDPGNRYGQRRVGSKGITERVCIRLYFNASTTIKKGKQYFSKVLTDGPISRISFSTIPKQPLGSPIPVYGTYDEKYDADLKPFIDNLKAAHGTIVCPQALRLARKMIAEDAEKAVLSENEVYENLSRRANVIAYLKGMILYVAQGMKWDKTIEDFVRWSKEYDMWCKMHFFGDAIAKAEYEDPKPVHNGPRNMLELLPDQFTLEDVIEMRRREGKAARKTSKMLYNWKVRGYIEQDGEGMWKKRSTPTSIVS